MTPPAPVRLGLLGCGWIAANRVRQIAASGMADVVAVTDPDPDALERIRQWAPRADNVQHIDALTPAQVDAVMISTPSALHSRQALTLIERGLPVFVQKPVGLSAAEVARVLDAAGRADVPVATDLCYRHLRVSQAVREALANDCIGRPFLIEACFHNAYRPGSGWAHDIRFAGGGALMDLGLHLLDLVMWLARAPLSLDHADLRCNGTAWQLGQVENFAALTLTGRDREAVRVVSAWDASTGLDAEIRLRIYGEHGNLELANRSGSFYCFDAWLCRGTDRQLLASDDDDRWQAEPLLDWLAKVADGLGYAEPAWVPETMSVIDQAYARGGTTTTEPTAARGTVHVLDNHVLDKKGVLP